MGGFIETATSPQFLLAALSAIAAFATFVSLVSPFMQGEQLNKRMKSVTTERERIRQRERARLVEQQNLSKVRLTSDARPFMQKIVDRFDLRKMFDDGTLQIKLAQAGLRGQRSIVIFLFFRLALPIVLGLVAAIYVFGLNLLEAHSLMVRILAVLLVAYAGFYLPNLYLKNRTTKRKASIKKAWPDALDLLLICVESGMSIEPSFKKVSEEIGEQSTELAAEMALTTAELSFLSDRRQAFENLASRADLEVVKSVTLALMQAEKYGTPIGQALRIMAQENRDLRMIEAEKKAASLPPKLTVPMIVFFLPVLFIVIMGPAVIKTMANFN